MFFELGENARTQEVIDLNEKILDLRVGLEPTTSTILERRLRPLGHRGSHVFESRIFLFKVTNLGIHLITF